MRRRSVASPSHDGTEWRPKILESMPRAMELGLILAYQSKPKSIKLAVHILPRLGATGGSERQVEILTRADRHRSVVLGLLESSNPEPFLSLRSILSIFKLFAKLLSCEIRDRNNNIYFLWLYPSLVSLVPLILMRVAATNIVIMVRCEYDENSHSIFERLILRLFTEIAKSYGICGSFNSPRAFVTHKNSGLACRRNFIVNNIFKA